MATNWNLSQLLTATSATSLSTDVTTEFMLLPPSTPPSFGSNNSVIMEHAFTYPATFSTRQSNLNERLSKYPNLTLADYIIFKNYHFIQSMSADHQMVGNMTFNESNNLLHPPCPSTQMPLGNLISMILYSIVFIVGLFGNTLVIYVVLRFSKMKTVTNLYILNLAIADECFLIGIPFLLITMHLGEWIFGKYLCIFYILSTSVTQFTSSIFLFIMSLDRYIAICHPISAPRLRTPLISKILVGISWALSALFMCPVVLAANTIAQKDGRTSCIIEWPEYGNMPDYSFTLYSLILGFAIPLLLILIFYYKVIKKLRTVGPKTKSKEKKRSHRKVTKLVLTVITVYILSWFPYWTSQVALINSPPGCTSRLEITVFVLVGCLGYSNSAMNPVLYAFLSDNFKKSFLKACTCAKGHDINAQLQVQENSNFFPRFGKRGSDRVASTSKTPKKAVKANARRNLTQSNQTSTLETATLMIETGGISRKSSINAAVPSMVTTSTTLSTSLQPVHAGENSLRPPVLHTDL